MNRQKIPHNFIENKIRQFKAGVDYRFEKEEYHAPEGNFRGDTSRSYKILSPQLQKVVQDYLAQQTAIFMQFEFGGWEFTGERIRPDQAGKDWAEKYHCTTSDENGNALNYGHYGTGAEAGYSLGITYWDKPRTPAEEFIQAYQKAKKVWEEKGSLLHNVPPKGTKCWSCYEVISEADIAAGRYCLENTRLGNTKDNRLTFFKTFEHVKEHGCKPAAYDPAQRNNFQYYNKWPQAWEQDKQNNNHEYSCQDCLNKLWHEVNGNLIYLETWLPEQTHEIGLTKQVLAEIKARLAKLEESGQFHNCGIKKCCAEHDRPEIFETKNRGLITTGNLEEFSKPKKATFNRQDLLDLMKEKGITKICRHPQNSEQLLIEYDNGQTENWSLANDFPAEWGKYLKQEVSQNPIYLYQPTNRDKPNRWPVGKIAVGASIIIGLVSVIGILVYRWTRKRK